MGRANGPRYNKIKLWDISKNYTFIFINTVKKIVEKVIKAMKY